MTPYSYPAPCIPWWILTPSPNLHQRCPLFNYGHPMFLFGAHCALSLPRHPTTIGSHWYLSPWATALPHTTYAPPMLSLLLIAMWHNLIGTHSAQIVTNLDTYHLLFAPSCRHHTLGIHLLIHTDTSDSHVIYIISIDTSLVRPFTQSIYIASIWYMSDSY